MVSYALDAQQFTKSQERNKTMTTLYKVAAVTLAFCAAVTLCAAENGMGTSLNDTVKAAWFVKDISCKVGTPLAD